VPIQAFITVVMLMIRYEVCHNRFILWPPFNLYNRRVFVQHTAYKNVFICCSYLVHVVLAVIKTVSDFKMAKT